MFSLPDSWLWDFWLAEDTPPMASAPITCSSCTPPAPCTTPTAGICGRPSGTRCPPIWSHWRQVPDALVHGDASSFDQTATWTGSVTKGPDGRWFMFYTGTTRHPDDLLVQQVGCHFRPTFTTG